jgi:hypothetical protein
MSPSFENLPEDHHYEEEDEDEEDEDDLDFSGLCSLCSVSDFRRPADADHRVVPQISRSSMRSD